MDEACRIGNTAQFSAGNKAQDGSTESGTFTVVGKRNGLVQYIGKNLQPKLRLCKAAAHTNVFNGAELTQGRHNAVQTVANTFHDGADHVRTAVI